MPASMNPPSPHPLSAPGPAETGYYYPEGEYPTTKRVPLRTYARCHCGQLAVSAPNWLAFWESAWNATLSCDACGYAEPCHDPAHENHRAEMAHDFIPSPPSEHDRFYCGHRGWD